jgi:uracil-DNA glycosylase family 4
VLLLGEGPGREEARRGVPFVGKSGRELDHQYLPLAGLCRLDVRVHNVTRCPFDDFRNPTHEEAAECAGFHLPEELDACQPEIVVAMGAVASSVFRPRIDLERHHGIVQVAEFGDWCGYVLPTYHPAAGLRDGRYIAWIREDFSRLGDVLRKGITFPVDAHPWPDYRELETTAVLDQVLRDGAEYLGSQAHPAGPAIDTESDMDTAHRPPPAWCVTFSFRPGTGYLIPAIRRELLEAFARYVERYRPLAVMHYALHDLPVLRQMGITLPRYTDTMMLACNTPPNHQALKTLAYRLCRMEMTDYSTLVTAHAMPKVVEYIGRYKAWFEAAYQYSHTLKGGPRKGETEARWLQDTPKDAKKTYNKAVNLWRNMQTDAYRQAVLGGGAPAEDSTEPEVDLDPDHFDREPSDPWKRWGNWHDDDRRRITQVVGGGMPKRSIVHVPRREAVYYACRDADATLRVYGVLARQARGYGREIR